jgi:hypothetical protein
MNESLEKLLKLALENNALKTELLATQNSDDPLDSFCKIATENGCPITVGEIFTLNQTLCDNLLKSTNGGATYPIEDWADAYEMFMSALI